MAIRQTPADTDAVVRVSVRAFGPVREALSEGRFEMTLSAGSTLVDLWELLRARTRSIDKYAATTRMAVNGSIAPLLHYVLVDGDEVALLPPFGGG